MPVHSQLNTHIKDLLNNILITNSTKHTDI